MILIWVLIAFALIWLLSPWALLALDRRVRHVLLAYPATLSLAMLAAHFFRNRIMIGVFLSVLMQLLLLASRNVTIRIVQAFLLVAGLEWLRATLQLINERQMEDEPWRRGAIILLSVEAFTVVSAILLQWFKRRPTPGFEPVMNELPPI